MVAVLSDLLVISLTCQRMTSVWRSLSFSQQTSLSVSWLLMIDGKRFASFSSHLYPTDEIMMLARARYIALRVSSLRVRDVSRPAFNDPDHSTHALLNLVKLVVRILLPMSTQIGLIRSIDTSAIVLRYRLIALTALVQTLANPYHPLHSRSPQLCIPVHRYLRRRTQSRSRTNDQATH